MAIPPFSRPVPLLQEILQARSKKMYPRLPHAAAWQIIEIPHDLVTGRAREARPAQRIINLNN
ncbi:MAG: hypothetical protein Q7J60_25790 [Bradyrhizobium sp.]|nr:hypothetical protein [Bradyrhizobium sp.]